MLDESPVAATGTQTVADMCNSRWALRARAALERDGRICRIACSAEVVRELCEWLMVELEFRFATLVVEQQPEWLLTYVFYKDETVPWVHIELSFAPGTATVPSLSELTYGPAIDWHEREAEDLFGLSFEGHPRLGEFVLHEDWPEGVNPMRQEFDATRALRARAPNPKWEPPTVVVAGGAFAMPIGPVFSDFAESAHFALETVGEDVIRTIPRFFYKYRGVEKLAEGQTIDRALLLAERFSGTAAVAHGLSFCLAVEEICGITVPERAHVLRVIFAELERLRHHAAAVTGICNSTALAVAASQAALIEEELLRLSGLVARHRYFFGTMTPGGVACDLSDEQRHDLAARVGEVTERLNDLHRMLRYSSSFLDRLEEVGVVSKEQAAIYGMVGPIARASGLAADIRMLFPYAAYRRFGFLTPVKTQGDGYARLRVFFQEIEQSAQIIHRALLVLPDGPIRSQELPLAAGTALAAVEAPDGAAFHWLRLAEDGVVLRHRITPPSFANWHGFHLAAENFAFQDFPIILASFGLSNAECDR